MDMFYLVFGGPKKKAEKKEKRNKVVLCCVGFPCCVMDYFYLHGKKKKKILIAILSVIPLCTFDLISSKSFSDIHLLLFLIVVMIKSEIYIGFYCSFVLLELTIVIYVKESPIFSAFSQESCIIIVLLAKV